MTDYQRKVDEAARVIVRHYLAALGLIHPNGYLRYGTYEAADPSPQFVHLHHYAMGIREPLRLHLK